MYQAKKKKFWEETLSPEITANVFIVQQKYLKHLTKVPSFSQTKVCW